MRVEDLKIQIEEQNKEKLLLQETYKKDKILRTKELIEKVNQLLVDKKYRSDDSGVYIYFEEPIVVDQHYDNEYLNEYYKSLGYIGAFVTDRIAYRRSGQYLVKLTF